VAEETIITNVGEDDRSSVASEATLLALVSAIEDLAKKAGINPASARAKVEKAAVDSTKISIKESKKYKDALENKTKATKEATNALNTLASRSFGVVTAILGGAVGAGTNFVKTLIEGGDTLTDFAQHVPLIGNQLSLLTGLIDSTVESFRLLSGAGISFGESIFEIRRMAAEARMSLETFSNVIRENSASLALLGGNTNQGVRRFAEISKIINEEFRPSLMNLGFNIDEVAEFTGSYLSQQIRLGRAQRMDARQLAEGTQEYILQLDRLARITGRSREELSRDLEAQLQDRRIAALVRSMDNDARMRMQGVLAGIENTDLKEAITEMIATGGVPLSEAGKGLASVIPGLADASRALRDGQITEEEFAEVLRSGAAEADEFLKQNGNTAAALAALGNEFYSLLPELARMTTFGAMSADAIREQTEARERQESALLSFNNALLDIRTEFFEKIQPLLPGIVQGFSNVLEYLTRAPVIDSFMNAVSKVVDFLLGPEIDLSDGNTERSGGFIDRMIADIEEKGIGQVMLDLFTSLGSTLMEGVFNVIKDNFVIGLTALFAYQGAKMALTAGITRLFSGVTVAPPAGLTPTTSGPAGGPAAGRGAALRGFLSRAALPVAVGALALEFFKLYQRGSASDELMQELRDIGAFETFQEDWMNQSDSLDSDQSKVQPPAWWPSWMPTASQDIQTPQSTQQDAAEQARRNVEAERQEILNSIAVSGIETRAMTNRLAEIQSELSGVVSNIQTPQSTQQDAAEQARRNLIAEREQILQEAAAIGMTSQEQQERLAEIRNQLEAQSESTNEMIDLLSRLNTTMERVKDIDKENLELQGYLAQIAAEQLAIEREIERNTERGSDISRGGLISFGGGR
jgi:hypothetical protein